jgi:hypothetical protein
LLALAGAIGDDARVGNLLGSAWALVLATVEDTRLRVRNRGRAAVFRALRLSGAAVASYLVAHALSPNTIPILAPLTALLVVQVTLTSTLWSGFERVISVMAGVLLAVIFSAVVGLTWWSLGALIAVSIVIGQLLRLGPNLVEVPISAMLVLAVGANSAGQAATGRLSETAIGAAVGVAVNVIFPPALRTLDAGARVEAFADRIAGVLNGAAEQLSAGPVRGRAEQWLAEARRLSRHVPGIEKDILDADEGRQLNLRALGTPRTSSSLRDGLDALEHSLVAVRSMFRSIADSTRDDARSNIGRSGGSGGYSGSKDGGDERVEGEYAADVREAFALLLRDLADCFGSFGRMVRAQVDEDAVAESGQLAAALTALREARARVTELLLLGPRSDPEYWELNVALLATVERVLRELDVEEYVRERERHLAEQDEGVSHLAAERLRLRSRRLSEQVSDQLPQLPLPQLPPLPGFGERRRG